MCHKTRYYHKSFTAFLHFTFFCRRRLFLTTRRNAFSIWPRRPKGKIQAYEKRLGTLIDIKEFPTGGLLLGGAWTTIFKREIRNSNPWCSLRFKNNHVRAANSWKMNSAPFSRGAGKCKRKECNMKLKLTIEEDKGKFVMVTYTGNVCHKASIRMMMKWNRKTKK